jgi:outer membrane protein OmpA-like peptidoglycan-associated protein
MRRRLALLTACSAFLLAAPAWALSPFFIFFDTGSSHLKPAGEAVLDNAAAALRTADVREIEITGHADRIGSDEDNLALSRRRAEAVRDALLARGLSRHVRVRIVAAGEGEPIIQTEDGIAEAQNRAVTIIIKAMCDAWPQQGRRTDGECAAPLPD